MKAANPWITYRTRFLVQAKQLTTSLTFTDVLDRQHSGRKGDYLVESSDGVLRIAPRQIFEDIYVPLLAEPQPASEPITPPRKETWRQNATQLPPNLTRKSPQPDRNGRSPTSGLRSL
jgi:hypothetical protein